MKETSMKPFKTLKKHIKKSNFPDQDEVAVTLLIKSLIQKNYIMGAMSMTIELFSNQLKDLSIRLTNIKTSIKTEEATKTSLIMPFFNILGYDVFNPLEFTPEYIADVGIKKGEKVDYAILDKGKPIILIEAKSVTEKLNKHDSQLFRYFGTSSSKIAILTNGDEYRFYTDLEEPNKMDSSPFFTFCLSEIKDMQVAEVFKFHKKNFNIENISNSASDLKYLGYVKTFLRDQIENPDEDFVKYIINGIYDGMKTKAIIDKFTPVVKKGFKSFIADEVAEKLSNALNGTIIPNEEPEEKHIPQSDIETTEEELEVYSIVKFILKDTISPDRIFYRDNRSYFNIILDDNIRKWILRLYINNSRKYIQLNNDEKTTFDISSSVDIDNYTSKLIALIQTFEK